MLSDKRFEKIQKVLGKESIQELDSLDLDQLADRIIAAENAINEAVDAVEANEEYQELKENIGAFRKGLSEVKQRQNAVIRYSLHLLEEKRK